MVSHTLRAKKVISHVFTKPSAARCKVARPPNPHKRPDAMNPDETKKILADHARWLAGERSPVGPLRLADADLRGVDMTMWAGRWAVGPVRANLADADLRGADLPDATLTHTKDLTP